MYDEIKSTKIKEVAETILNGWIEQEVIDLANDFGQRPDNEMLLHTCKRLRGVLLTKYKSWYVGDVHAAFQTGLSGAYGAFHKVTVKTLFYFLKMAQNQLSNSSIIAHEIESATKNNEPRHNDPRYNTAVCQLYSWATANFICLDFIDPSWPPEKTIKEKAVSPKITALGAEYLEAKEMDLLISLKHRLLNEQLKIEDNGRV